MNLSILSSNHFIFDTFQSKLQTSKHFFLNTSVWISLTNFQCLFTVFPSDVKLTYYEVQKPLLYIGWVLKQSYTCITQIPSTYRTWPSPQNTSSCPFTVNSFSHLPFPKATTILISFFHLRIVLSGLEFRINVIT